jgi:hypothetical protein
MDKLSTRLKELEPQSPGRLRDIGDGGQGSSKPVPHSDSIKCSQQVNRSRWARRAALRGGLRCEGRVTRREGRIGRKDNRTGGRAVGLLGRSRDGSASRLYAAQRK